MSGITALCLAASIVTGACGGTDNGAITKTDDPRSGGQSGFAVTTSEPLGGTAAPPGTDAATTPTTAATVTVPDDDGAALQMAVAAYGAALGTPTIRTLEFIVQFPEGQASYGYLQSQDPNVPANVDQRDWRDGVVADPEPVRLTGQATDLEANLFSLDEIDWVAISAALPTAPGQVEGKLGPLSNSKGVTHLIAQRNLPFSNDVVVRVYVDGGDRTTGGYVQYLANGTLDKIQA